MTLPTRGFHLIGSGVYTIAEAARLTHVPAHRIVRWTRGYWYIQKGERRYSKPIIGVGLGASAEGAAVLQFDDLVEIRFLSAFRKYGVGWKTIRLAASKAHALLQEPHPFATKIFRTDGRKILAELISELSDTRLIDLVSDQLEWEGFVRPHLHEAGIEFDERGRPRRWWPLGEDRPVVIDPARAFGAPVVHPEGVQTYLLARAVAVEGDADLVAHWYEVPVESVREAVRFESTLRAA